MPSASSVHEFGSFRLDPAERLLLREGQPVSLTPKAFDLLVYLVDHAGRLVTKQALMSALWPDSFVEESNLTFTVSALRKALGDGQDGEQFIQTVPTRGYRFVARVTTHETGPDASASGTPARSFKPLIRPVATIALAGAIVAMLPVVVRHLRERPEVPGLARFTIPVPESTTTIGQIPMAPISPDGRRVALVPTLGSRIWLREIDGLAAVPIAGTERAISVAWAPDSQQIVFSTASELKTLKVADGTIQMLCTSCQPTGGLTWSRSGLILFTTQEGLVGIPAAGGGTQPVTTVDPSQGEISHLYPHFLPDGVRYLYVRRNKDAARTGLYVGQVGSAASRLLLEGDLPAIYAAPGYLLFGRGGALMAQRFDSRSLRFSGEATPLGPLASGNLLVGQAIFSASEAGRLTYTIVERDLTQFQWVGRDGNPQQLVGEPGRYYTFDLTADASRLVFARVDEAGDASLWSFDLARGLRTPLTFGSSFFADPRWMPDGQGVVATKWRPLPQSVVHISRDGRESILPLPGEGNMVEDVSQDGRYLLFRHRGELLAMALREGSKPFLVRKAPTGIINQSQFSPDGRWIAYHANESGRFEVYVTPFPRTGEPSRVSSGGGVQPVWRQDGRELYYLGLDGHLNAVTVRMGGRPEFSTRPLFQTGLLPGENVEQYAASADGRRFLLLKVIDNRSQSSIGVVLNWPALLAPSPSR